MHYIQCSSQWFMDKDICKLVSEAKRVTPYEADIPWYLWKYGDAWEHKIGAGFERVNGELQTTFSVMRKTHTVTLNALSIEFTQEYKHANIRFFDKIKGLPVKLELDANPDTVLTAKNGRKYREILGIGYQIKNDGVAQQYYCGFDKTKKDAFRFIGGLGKHEGASIAGRRFSYGLTPVPYTVKYMGRELGGNSFAMMCGPWAILLDDDYSFDALVFLKSAKAWDLEVERFVYTTNTYIIKVMTLWK